MGESNPGSGRIRAHIRSNVVGYLAVFLALSGTAAALPANSVDSQDIINGEVKKPDVGAGAIGTSELANDAVRRADLAADAVGPTELAKDAVRTGDILNRTVRGADVADENLTFDDLAPDSVGRSEIATGAIGSGEVETNSLTGSDIVEGSLDLDLATQQVGSGGGTTSPKSVTASCPVGTQVIGGDYWIGGGTSATDTAVAVTEFQVSIEANEVRAKAYQIGGTSAPSWELRVEAICADIAG